MKLPALSILFASVVFLVAACASNDPPPQSTHEPTMEAAGTGTLEVRVTSGQPDSRVSNAIVTIGSIEANASADSEDSGWQTIASGPRQFDLAKLEGVEESLGSATLEPGRYQRLRLEITEAVLTMLGSSVREAEVLAEQLEFAGPFEVAEGATTVLTLDFDAEGSLKFRPGVGPGLDPMVRLLAREEGQTLAQAIVVATVGKEAASGPAAGTGSPSSTVRVALPVDDNLQWMNFYIAQGAGFFEDEGLDVQLVVPPDPFATTRLMAMGQAGVAVLPRPLYLQAVGRGEPVVAIANLLANDPINLVVHGDVAEARGLSADMPLVERLKGLRGLRVGVAPGPPVRLRTLFASVGLDADRDIEMVILPSHAAGGQNTPFGEREVDALYAHTPFLETALVDQGAVMLVHQSGGEVPELANRQVHTLTTTRDYANSNSQTLMAMARAIYRAQQLIHSDLQASAKAIRASGVKLQAPQGLETIIAIYEPAIPRTPQVSVAGALRELEFYPAHLDPPDLSGVDMSQHVDNRFAQQAVASAKSTSSLIELTIVVPPVGVVPLPSTRPLREASSSRKVCRSISCEPTLRSGPCERCGKMRQTWPWRPWSRWSNRLIRHAL